MLLYRRYRPVVNLTGFLLLAALLVVLKPDLPRTLTYLAHAQTADIALAVVFFVPFLAAKAWRWQVILRDLGIRIPFGEAIKLYALGLGAGMVTPGQVGDAVKVAYFRQRGLGRALVSVLLDRLWDVLALLLLAGSGTLVFWRQFEGEWVALALVMIASIGLLGLTASARAQQWLLYLLERIRGSGTGRMAFEPIRLSPPQILRQFTLTLLATAIVYLRLYLLTTALDIHLAAVPFVAMMSLASVAALLPISISGVGTRDVTLLLMAPIVGIENEQALGISALILLLSVLNGLVGYVVWSIWKLEPGMDQLEA